MVTKFRCIYADLGAPAQPLLANAVLFGPTWFPQPSNGPTSCLVCMRCPPPAGLTQFMLSWVVRDLHDVEFQPLVTLADAVDTSDVRTSLVHRLHQLEKTKQNSCLEKFY